ncbi:MAG: RluA family pseudouridine synthase [Roseibium sp.]
MTENSQEVPAEMDTDYRLTVDLDDAGKRLDAVLAANLETLSRNRIQTLIKAGDVTVGGAKVVEPKRRVNEGDVLTLTLPEPEDPEPKGEDIPISVVFEDEHLIVIDKPSGLVVHPGAGNWTGTLVNALIHHCGESLSGVGGVRRPGIVHRIDKDTSGLLVVAKTDQAHQGLAAQFADHGRTGPLERAYSALIWGAPTSLKGTINANLARSQSNRQKIAVVKTSGRQAITHWQVKERYGVKDEPALASLMECRLETGRTHQIRVHMAHIGHPLIGDSDYGSGFKTKINRLEYPLKSLIGMFERQALHAGLLAFEHPVSGETLRFESQYPADFANLLSGLRKF